MPLMERRIRASQQAGSMQLGYNLLDNLYAAFWHPQPNVEGVNELGAHVFPRSRGEVREGLQDGLRACAPELPSARGT